MVKFQAIKQQKLHKNLNELTANNYDFDDLIQAGSEGLMKAIERYDVRNEKGASFNTYAYWWVRGYISNFLNFSVSTIHVPIKRRKTHKVTMVEMDKPENEWKSFSVDDGEEMSSLDILWLNDHLSKCFDRESIKYECLARRFGIDDRPESTVNEIAKDLGLERQ